MSTIPQQAVEWLLTDTTGEKRKAFDAKYGAGASEQAIAEVNAPAEEPAVEGRSWWDVAGAVAADVGEGLLEAPGAIASGLYEGAVVAPADFLTSLTGDVLIYNPENGEYFDYISPAEIEAQKKAGEHYLTDKNPLVGIGEDTFTGKFINDASQFTGAFVGLGKVFKGGSAILGTSKAAGAATVTAQSAGATFIGFEGNEGRITDMLLDMGVPDEMLPDFLETDPDDSEAMGRLKNVVEEGPLGVLGVVAVKAFRAVKKGDQAAFDAAVKEAEAIHASTKDELNARIEADVAEKTPSVVDESVSTPDQLSSAQRESQFEEGLEAIRGAKTLDEVEAAKKAAVDNEAPDVSPDDIKSAQPASEFPEKTPGFGMTATHHKRIEDLGAKLAENPDGKVAGSMGWRSHDLINAPEAVEAEIAATAKVLAKQFDQTKGKPQSEQLWKMQSAARARALAELTGVDDKKIIENVNKFDNPRTMAADLIARENYALSLSENITQIARAIRHHTDTGDVTEITKLGYKSVNEAKLAIVQRRELAANVVASVQGARSNIARAMRAMQMVRSGDDNLLRILAKDQGLERTADEIVAAAVDGPAAGRKGLLGDVAKSSGKIGDAINFYRINALLSGPGTQEVNMISNAINAFAIPVQQMVGGAVTLNGSQVMHATRTLRGMLGGSVESVKTALRAAYNDEAILDPFGGKLDVQEAGGAAKGAVGKVVSLPSRFLLTADEFFKQAQYRGRIFADAVAEADQLGKKGADKKAFIKSYLDKSFDEFGGATRGQALLQAQRATFTENLDGEMSRLLQRAAIKNNFVRFVIPFVRTPLNILSQGFQHFPGLGFLSKRLRDDLAAGGPRRAQAIGRQSIGTALTVTGFTYAAMGMMTGSGPKDPRVRAQWLRTNKPYSFVIKQKDGSVKFIPYQRYEPFSYPLSLMADVVEILEYNKDISRVEASEMVAAVIGAVAENTVNKTFTQGLSDIFELLTDTERSLENYLESQAGSFVPNIIPQMLDRKEKREIRGVVDSLQARIGMDSTMDRKRNALGEVDVNYGSKMDPLGIFAQDIRKPDVVMQEFTRLSEVHQSGFGNPPSRMGDVDLKDVAYEDDQSMYDRLLELQGTVKIGGKTLRQTLTKTINSRSYKSLSDGNRDFTGENEKLLKKIILSYRELAEKTLMKERPDFKKLHLEFQQQKRSIKRRKRPTLIEEITNGSR